MERLGEKIVEKEDELEEGTAVLLTLGLGEPSDTTDISAADDSGFPPLLDVVLMVLCVSFAIMVPLIFGIPVLFIPLLLLTALDGEQPSVLPEVSSRSILHY